MCDVWCACTLHCDVQDVWKLWVMHGVYMTLHLRDKGQSHIVLYLPGTAVLQGWAWDWKRAGTKALASLDVSSRPSPGIWPWQIARTWTVLRHSQSGLAGSPGKLTKLWPSSTLISTFSCTQQTLWAGHQWVIHNTALALSTIALDTGLDNSVSQNSYPCQNVASLEYGVQMYM